jgi:hypothetical protein
MKRTTKWIVLLGMAALLSGCATGGPKYTEMSQSMTAPQAGTERIWFYRTTAMGFAVQPVVNLNGEPVGKAVPQAFFYADRPPGDYTVSTSTEVEKNLTFRLEQGQPRYVRLNIGLGIMVGRVYGVLVDEETARKEMESTSYLQKAAAN